ncbi:MAG: ABC transporter permease [Thermoplasmatales archaeon]
MQGKGTGFSTVFYYYLRNYYRSRSFYLIFILMLTVSALMVYLSVHYLTEIRNIIPVGTNIKPEGKERILLYIWAYVLSDIPVFAAVFFSSPAVSSEIENRTAFHIFSLPIDRSVLLIGKYAAAVAASIISMSPYMVAEIGTASYIFGFLVSTPFFISTGMLLIFITSVSAFSFLISSLFNKNLYAYITTFIIYFIVFSSLNLVLELIYNYNAFFLLDNAASIISRSFIDISPGVFTSKFSLNGASYGDVMTSLLVMVLYAVVSIVLSLLIFERKEVR